MFKKRHGKTGKEIPCAVQSCEHLKKLSMDELQNRLEEKFDSLSEKNFDPEEITACLSAMDDRQPMDYRFDTEVSLRDFHEKHAVLFEQYENSNPAARDVVKLPRPRKTVRFWMAAAIAVLLMGAVVAQAAGVDVFRAAAKWTKDVFGFTTAGENGGAEQDAAQPTDTQYSDLQSALDAYGIEAEVVPAWIPEGFSLFDLKVNASPLAVIFNAFYTNGDKALTVMVRYHASESFSTYEKDDRPVTVYEKGGITHYIMTNLSQYTAAWLNGDLECSIFGDISKEDIIRMIDSIYGG